MTDQILPPVDTVSHLAIQSLLSDLADVTHERDIWRTFAQASLARLHSMTGELTRASAAVKMLRREITRYTAGQMGRGA